MYFGTNTIASDFGVKKAKITQSHTLPSLMTVFWAAMSTSDFTVKRSKFEVRVE